MRRVWIAIGTLLVLGGAYYLAFGRVRRQPDPLCVAVYAGDTARVQTLLAHGAKLDAPGDAGLNPENCECVEDPGPAPALTFAAFGGRADVVKLLLDRGADVNTTGAKGMTALMWARRAATVQLLLKRGAKIDARDRDGRTALMVHQDRESLEALLAAGADVNARDNAGKTPLMEIAAHSEARVVQALLARGADAGARDNTGKTALDYAMQSGAANVIALLRRASDRTQAGVKRQDQTVQHR